MDDWRERLRRECREMEAAIRAALALTSDEAVRAEIERLVTQPQFNSFTWLWLPALGKRDRVMFRPFMLSSFSREAIDGKAQFVEAWKGETGAALEALLADVDKRDDVELTKRLYTWRLEGRRDADKEWREDVIARLKAAPNSAARNIVLAKTDRGAWPGLDPDVALEMWQIDRVAVRKYILSHLPWQPARTRWQRLLDASRDVDVEFHFELYRKIVDQEHWEKDVLALPKTPDIGVELERRHPATPSLAAADVFYALLEKHGDAAVGYVKRHVANAALRWVWHGTAPTKKGKGVPALLALSLARGWLDLWAALLRTVASAELFDAEIKKLVHEGNRARLELVPGRGREFHGAGFSWSIQHALSDGTACEMYAKYPALVRGAYRTHITPVWSNWYPALARAAIAARDHELIAFLASRIGAVTGDGSQKAAADALIAHYEALSEADFVTQAAAALSRMPPHGIWNYQQLVDYNALAKLLFEISTTRYLADGAAVRDLLESPQIYVQLLAFRILGQDDPRARELAAANVDLLQATLLRRLRATSRKLAFGALRNAAAHDEATARHLLGKMRDALALPEKRYPVEELVGLIGFTLHRWPALRGASEQPVIYGAQP